MYHTPAGDRILLDAERRFFVHSSAMIVDMLAGGDLEFDVAAFDRLQRNQKLAALYVGARGLLRPNEPPPKLTAYVEAAVATVYEFARQEVYQEIDDPEFSENPTYWRRLVLEAARERAELDEFPEVTSNDKGLWNLLIECLAGCVLWDIDYALEGTMDLPPEKSRKARDVLGLDEDYYTDVPDDPRDDQVKLYLDALIGLTLEARHRTDNED
jgi:hypothetical protein